MIAALVFDLDDTLYAERDFVASGFRAVDAWLRREHDTTGFAEAAQRSFDCGVRGTIFDEAVSRLDLSRVPGLIQRMVDVYRGHAPALELLPDARRALALWRGRVHLGLITDGYAAMQRNKIHALGLEHVFDHVICTDELGRACWKPSPVAFAQIAERFSCESSSCVYVADNPAKDFVAPNRLGWLTVRVRREGGEHYAAGRGSDPAHQAQHTVDSLDELADVLPAGPGVAARVQG